MTHIWSSTWYRFTTVYFDSTRVHRVNCASPNLFDSCRCYLTNFVFVKPCNPIQFLYMNLFKVNKMVKIIINKKRKIRNYRSQAQSPGWKSCVVHTHPPHQQLCLCPLSCPPTKRQWWSVYEGVKHIPISIQLVCLTCVEPFIAWWCIQSEEYIKKM